MQTESKLDKSQFKLKVLLSNKGHKKENMSKSNDYNMKQNKVDESKVKSAHFCLKLSTFIIRRGNEIITIPILSLNKIYCLNNCNSREAQETYSLR